MLKQQDRAAPEFLTTGDVARLLGVSRNTVLRLEAKDVLHPVRITESSHRRYRRAEVDALLAA